MSSDTPPYQPTRSALERVERARRGDERAWEELFNEHYPLVFRFFRARVASSEQAEDLASNVFLQAVRSIDGFAWQGKPFSAWLFGIARHELASHYRSLRPAALAIDDEVGEPAVRSEFLEVEIRDILERLPRDYREALELRFVIGLSGIEAAAAMGRTHGSFRSLLLRATRAFRAESERDAGSGTAEAGNTDAVPLRRAHDSDRRPRSLVRPAPIASS